MSLKLVLGKSDAVRACEELAKLCPSIIKPLASNVLTVHRQEIEGIQEHARVIASRMQPVEIRHAILAANHRLAIDQEPGDTQPVGGMRDPGIALGPIETAATGAPARRRATPAAGTHRA